LPSYIYKARDASGKAVRGVMEAAAKEELIDKLRKMGYMATYVNEVSPGINIESLVDRLRIISTEDMIVFNVQLSNMINAGINILTSLAVLKNQIENKKLRDVVDTISRSVEGGDTFSQALSRHPRVFPSIFVSMVKAGEASGQLDTILTRYAVFAEQQQDLRQKIQSALFYPLILIIAGIIVTLFIVTFIIPQFTEIFVKAGVQLPVPTLILYKIGTGIKRFWPIIILLVILVYLSVRAYVNTQAGKLRFDRFKLKLPIIGSLHRKAAISRFTRTLGTLVTSGVPILESLNIVKEAIGNEVLARVIENVRDSVEKGEKLAEPLKISEEFPLDTVQMIAVGEETGNLDTMLNKISDFYDMYLGYTIKKLTAIIEPLFLLIIGGLVAFIMASMLLPIFDMIKTLRH